MTKRVNTTIPTMKGAPSWRDIILAGAIIALISTTSFVIYSSRPLASPLVLHHQSEQIITPTEREKFGEVYEKQQSLFCRLRKYNQIAALRQDLPQNPLVDAASSIVPIVSVQAHTSAGTFDVYLYNGQDNKDKDIVSNTIMATGNWEPQAVATIKEKLQNVALITGETPGFMDIGSNIGWFTFNMAAAGYPVLSFEPMSQNEILQRTTLCGNPTIMSRVAYFPIGLGRKESHCYIISGHGNVGDGHTVCDQGMDYRPPENYVVRGELSTFLLSKVLSAYSCTSPDEKISSEWRETPYGLHGTPRIGVLKIDVEGYEPNVLEGGLHFFRCAQIPYIRSEVSPGMMGGMDIAVDYLKRWISLGYEIRVDQDMWGGPVLREEDVRTYLELNNGIIDMHMVHKGWIDHAAKMGINESVGRVWSKP
ncbi:hypothetical protein BJ742DRAFT_852526 [Cladochytrium replicatum]|nr:hypothetical protein BJ742DRAFT_852526 [Cladochytrium replicatum]